MTLKHNPTGGEETRDVPALSCRAEVGAVNEDKRTVDVVWTTGAKVLRSSYYEGQFYEELSLDPKHVRMGRLNNGAPFLADHNGYDVARTLGVVESARLEKGRGTATVRFAKAEDDPEADKIFRKIKDKIIQNVSVGYRIYKVEKIEAADEKVPTLRVIDWEPSEISAVAMGADDGAGFRSASPTELNKCTFISRSTEKNGMTPEEIAAAEAKALEQRNAELKAAAAVEAATSAELARGLEIRKVTRVLGADAAVHADKLIADKVSVDAARAFVIDTLAKRSDEVKTENHVRVEVTDDNQDKFIRGVSAAVFERSGTALLIEQAKVKGTAGFEKVSLDAGEFRGMGFADIARACLERRGISARHIFDKSELFRLALSQRGYAGTSDFATLLENVMFKQMRAAYATQGDTWSRWCGTDEVQDFRDAHRFGLGSFGTLDLKGENGEYKNKSIPDGEKKTIQTEIRGNIIGVSREMLINDDMGAMGNLATAFGRSGSRSIEVAAYDLLAENSGLGPDYPSSDPFFHTSNANVSTSAAITAAALDLDRQQMRAQKDLSDNDYLDLNPTILLVHTNLESTAKVLNSDAYDPAQVGQKTNIARGMFTDIIASPRVASSGERYLFDSGKEAFKVVFQAGEGRGPVMEMQNGWRTDGVEWKARITFKVCPFDAKAAVFNAGG